MLQVAPSRGSNCQPMMPRRPLAPPLVYVFAVVSAPPIRLTAIDRRLRRPLSVGTGTSRNLQRHCPHQVTWTHTLTVVQYNTVAIHHYYLCCRYQGRCTWIWYTRVASRIRYQDPARRTKWTGIPKTAFRYEVREIKHTFPSGVKNHLY